MSDETNYKYIELTKNKRMYFSLEQGYILVGYQVKFSDEEWNYDMDSGIAIELRDLAEFIGIISELKKLSNF
jgi:hypothetical protein